MKHKFSLRNPRAVKSRFTSFCTRSMSETEHVESPSQPDLASCPRRSAVSHAFRATFSQVWTWGEPRKYQANAGPSTFQMSQTPSLPISPSL